MPESKIKNPKYEQPKILLLDLESSDSEGLENTGYNISTGSLGTPYSVNKSNEHNPVFRKYYLPQDYKEHDIVIIDLDVGSPKNRDELENLEINPNVDYWWVNHEYGFVNPRLLNGNIIQDDFNRIFNVGGIFVVFAAEKIVHEFKWGHKTRTGQFYSSDRSKKISNWSFLNITNFSNYFNVDHDHGSIIKLSDDVDQNSILGQFLSGYLEDANFKCTIGPGYQTKNEWLNLLVNKYGDSVGGVLNPDNSAGMVFIFPDIKNKSKFLFEFIHDILPTLKPQLFPEIENTKWVNWPEYELAEVKVLNNEIDKIQQNAKKKISNLKDQIVKVKEQHRYLFDLIRETGDNLVSSVIRTLNLLGFEKVIDVDQEIQKNNTSEQKREDIQILDSNEILISEVKGINNYPSDEDALTVQKYVILRMREWNKTKIKGLSIINSQRHLPPLERENDMPFRREILENALEQKIGLLTTWDLHRIARNFLRLGWQFEHIESLFYQSGRINPVPNHYEFIGTIERYIDEISIVGVLVSDGVINANDRISFELPIFFEEQLCESMEYENSPVEKAKKGMLVGIKTHLEKHQAKSGTKVYRVATV